MAASEEREQMQNAAAITHWIAGLKDGDQEAAREPWDSHSTTLVHAGRTRRGRAPPGQPPPSTRAPPPPGCSPTRGATTGPGRELPVFTLPRHATAERGGP